MATVKGRQLALDDTILFVLSVLEDRPEIPLEELKGISRQVSGTSDREVKRRQILELADELCGNVEKGVGVA